MNGLCLSGGGIKAACHIGALKALEEKNIKFDCISGASSGSIIATLYALGFSSDEMYKIFKNYSHKVKYVDIKNIFKLIYGLIVKRKIIIDGLNSGNFIESLIKKICNSKGVYLISDIQMPIMIPMVDILSGTVYVATSKEVRNTFSDDIVFLTNMPIEKAVRASCSFPGVFSPLLYEGKQFVDGGIRENMAWKELKEIGATNVLGISFETLLNKKTCCNNMIETSIRSIDLLCHELSNYELNGIDHLIKIPSNKVSLLDTSQIDKLYKIGYNITKQKLKNVPL